MHSISNPGLWIGFISFIAIILIIDMVLLDGRKSHTVSTRKALCWTFIWALCALIFNGVLWLVVQMTHGPTIAHQKALEFFTGYVIEETLSFDNMFVILMIFNYFSVPAEYQRRVLLYGIVGALLLRFLMIFSGIWLVNQFHWLLYVFGIFLIVTGIKMCYSEESNHDISHNPLLRGLQRCLRLTSHFHAEKFFIRQNHLLYATPLLLVLILVEVSDLIFAFDSIPAIFAITRDPFIVFTSNILAILGLRAIYFLLAGLAHQFHLLKYGIAMVLMVVGVKLLLEHWLTLPIHLTLGIIISILSLSIALSLMSRNCNSR